MLCTAYWLGKAKVWKELYTNDTTRRQISLTGLVILIKERDTFVPVVVLAHEISTNYTAMSIRDSIVYMIEECGKFLDRWRDIMAEKFPDIEHDISSSKLHLGKL